MFFLTREILRRSSSNKSFRPGKRLDAVESSVVDVIEPKTEVLLDVEVRSVEDGIGKASVSGNRVQLGTDVRSRKVSGNSGSGVEARSRSRRLSLSQSLAEKFSARFNRWRARRPNFWNVDEVDLAVDIVQKSGHVSLEGAGWRRGRGRENTPLLLVGNPAVFGSLVEADIGVVVTGVQWVAVVERFGVGVPDLRDRCDLS